MNYLMNYNVKDIALGCRCDLIYWGLSFQGESNLEN